MAKTGKSKKTASAKVGRVAHKGIAVRTKSGRIVLTSPAKSATTRASWSEAFKRA